MTCIDGVHHFYANAYIFEEVCQMRRNRLAHSKQSKKILEYANVRLEIPLHVPSERSENTYQ